MDEQEWKEALVKIYIRALRDPVFRLLCLTNPLEAVLQATGITLPPGTKIEFWEDPAAKTYSYQLPPVRSTNGSSEDEEDALIRWATVCTDDPTHGPPVT